MFKGTIKLVTTRGFGFIRPDTGGDDVFFHVTAVATQEPEFRSGERVIYNLSLNKRNGRTKAVGVRRL